MIHVIWWRLCRDHDQIRPAKFHSPILFDLKRMLKEKTAIQIRICTRYTKNPWYCFAMWDYRDLFFWDALGLFIPADVSVFIYWYRRIQINCVKRELQWSRVSPHSQLVSYLECCSCLCLQLDALPPPAMYNGIYRKIPKK